jgi:hypothetical protein
LTEVVVELDGGNNDSNLFPTRHTCRIRIASYALTTLEMPLTWHPVVPIIIYPEDILLSRFSLESWALTYSNLDLSVTLLGHFQSAVLELSFRREFGYYLVNVYLPLIMLVLISWISFWFDVTAIDARIALGVTTILTMATQTFGFNQISPPVSHAKAVDIFIGICQVFVALALLEFALVDITLRQHRKEGRADSVIPHKKGMDGGRLEWEWEEGARRRAKRIDRVSRAFFPFLFIIFLILYFFICFTH